MKKDLPLILIVIILVAIMSFFTGMLIKQPNAEEIARESIKAILRKDISVIAQEVLVEEIEKRGGCESLTNPN